MVSFPRCLATADWTYVSGNESAGARKRRPFGVVTRQGRPRRASRHSRAAHWQTKLGSRGRRASEESDDKGSDSIDPGGPERRRMVGQARTRIRTEICGHGLEPHLPRSTRRRSRRSSRTEGCRVGAPVVPYHGRRVRLLGITPGTQPAAIRRHPLSQREHLAGNDRLRTIRSSCRQGRDRMVGPNNYRRWRGSLVQVWNQRTWI